MRGRTNFGDSIEDEWLIVYLLREITKKHRDIWVKVVDGDGEFLLAEAAGVLPAWLEPEVADNRVCFPLGVSGTCLGHGTNDGHLGMDTPRAASDHKTETGFGALEGESNREDFSPRCTENYS